jgi:hypothetical protein
LAFVPCRFFSGKPGIGKDFAQVEHISVPSSVVMLLNIQMLGYPEKMSLKDTQVSFAAASATKKKVL